MKIFLHGTCDERQKNLPCQNISNRVAEKNPIMNNMIFKLLALL